MSKQLSAKAVLMAALMCFIAGQAYAFQETTPVSQWVPNSKAYALVGVDSRQFTPYMTSNPNKKWALTTPKPNTLRFELRSGDVNSYDFSVAGNTKERSEIGTVQRFPNGVPVHISYNLMIEPGEDATSWWGTVIGQMHQDGIKGSPPFDIALKKGNMLMVDARNSSSETLGKVVGKIDRGKTYKIDIFFKGGANGRMMVLVNGQTFYDYSGLTGKGPGSYYWKLGAYRAASVQTVAVNYTGLIIESGDAVEIGVLKKLPAPTLKVGYAGFVTDIGGNNVPQGAEVTLYDNGAKFANVVGSAWKSFNVKARLAPGVHYITADYKGSQLSKEIVVATGPAADIFNKFDLLTNAEGLASAFMTDGNAIAVPATTNFPTFIEKNKRVISKISNPLEFVIYAGAAGGKRADYYSREGKKLRTEKLATQ